MTREEAIEILSFYQKSLNNWEMDRIAKAFDMAIEALSADEVVRCKDCKWWHTDDCPMYHEEWFTVDEGFGFFDDDYNIIDNTTDNGFCHMGERK